MATFPRPFHFTTEEYEQMGAAGILSEDDWVERIAGEIIERAAVGVRHANCVRAWIRLLRGLVPHGMLIDVQNPIKVRNDGEPQPDVAVLYDRAHDSTPTEADTLFVVEVSDSLLAYDRSTKLPLYAAAGIAEAWLVDLNAGIVERHTEPYEGAYWYVVFARAGETLRSIAVPEIIVSIAAILQWTFFSTGYSVRTVIAIFSGGTSWHGVECAQDR